MILPSIDLMKGQAVQLVGGVEQALDAGDPFPIAQRFAVAGEIAVVDLDAALGQGDNSEIIERLLRTTPCRVGGGIRDIKGALSWLDKGATKVVLGTAAVAEVLEQLPADRVVAALDSVNGEVVVKGWRERTGRQVEERIHELRNLVGHFLITFVEREGRMQGIDLERAARYVEAARPARVTIAGGITTPDEVAALDRLGADAQIGMALYTGRLDLADALAAPLSSDRADGLWPTVVTDERGVALGLAYSDAASLREALRQRRGIYRSRSRGLWVKGETSGNTQELLKVDLDCDRDTLRFTVRQRGPFCHRDTRSCWGPDRGLDALTRLVEQRAVKAPPASYTRRLFANPDLLRAKLLEEAKELVDAETREDVIHEAADLLYFTLASLAAKGVSLEEVERELERRSLRVRRRGGDAKANVAEVEP